MLEDVKFIMPLELQSARQLTLVATKSGAGGIVSDKHPGNMIKYVEMMEILATSGGTLRFSSRADGQNEVSRHILREW